MSGEPILIVEDNPVNSKLFRVVLEKAGFHVLVAKDADCAFGALADFSPRLILMDVQLPQLDGFELTRRLKADARYCRISVVALTAYAMKGDRERALDAGCDGYIAKPIDTRTFVDSVRQYLYPKPVAAPTDADPGGRLILVVDDDHLQRRLLEMHLTQLGFETIPARDGAEAIERILSRTPHLVVSDILMPRLDGFRLVQFIRHKSSLSSLPIVLMTSGAIRPSDQDIAHNLGANCIVPRTDGLDHIASAIRSALAQGALSALAEDQDIIEEQRKHFIEEGSRDSRNLLESFHSGFDFAGARKQAHRWAGIGGTLGLPQVSQAAFDIERMSLETEPDLPVILAKLAGVHDLFSVAARAESAVTISDAAVASLSSKRFAAIGFDEVEARRLKETIEQARAVLRIRYAVPAASERWTDLYDATILNVTEDFDTRIGAEFLTTTDKPVVAIGLSSPKVEEALNRHCGEHDFLLRPWNPSELVLRCHTVIRRSAQRSVATMQLKSH